MDTGGESDPTAASGEGGGNISIDGALIGSGMKRAGGVGDFGSGKALGTGTIDEAEV